MSDAPVSLDRLRAVVASLEVTGGDADAVRDAARELVVARVAAAWPRSCASDDVLYRLAAVKFALVDLGAADMVARVDAAGYEIQRLCAEARSSALLRRCVEAPAAVLAEVPRAVFDGYLRERGWTLETPDGEAPQWVPPSRSLAVDVMTAEERAALGQGTTLYDLDSVAVEEGRNSALVLADLRGRVMT